MTPTRPSGTSCPPKPTLTERTLINLDQARELTSLFKMLGNETRARVLHALLQADELCVSELAEAVGMKAQAVSNQLQRLADRRVVATRRQGTTIHYRVVDPCVADIFDRALCLLEDAKSGVHARTP